MLLLQTADAGMLHHHLTITFGVIWAAWNLGHLFAFQHYKHLTPARSIRASRHFRHTPLWKLQDLLLHCHDIVVSEQQFIKLHCSSVPIYRSIAMLLICCHYCFVVVINLHRASRGVSDSVLLLFISQRLLLLFGVVLMLFVVVDVSLLRSPFFLLYSSILDKVLLKERNLYGFQCYQGLKSNWKEFNRWWWNLFQEWNYIEWQMAIFFYWLRLGGHGYFALRISIGFHFIFMSTMAGYWDIMPPSIYSVLFSSHPIKCSWSCTFHTLSSCA